MKRQFPQAPYGPHVPDSLRQDGWWLDYIRVEVANDEQAPIQVRRENER